MNPEKRRNPLINGEIVIIAPERSNRPFAFINSRHSLSSENCPFCPGHEDKTFSETLAYRPAGSNQNDSDWWLRFVPNMYPAVTDKKNGTHSQGMFEKYDAIGIHEVCITREHGADFGELEFDKNRNLTYEVLWAIHERKIELSEQKPDLVFAKFFKNRGEDAGGSLDHPHIQLLAIDEIPDRNRREYMTSWEHLLSTGNCLLCQLMGEEKAMGDRIVDENNHFIVLQPFASRFPYETWIVPKKHERSYFMDNEKASSLSNILRETFARLNVTLKNPDYNFYIKDSSLHEPSPSNGRDRGHHWYIELSPRLTKLGGWDYDTSCFINPLAPEQAAENLRKVNL